MGIIKTVDIVKEFKLDIVAGKSGVDRVIDSPDLSRPALELAGYFSHYDPSRVQILGTTELSFFSLLSDKEKKTRMRMLCTRKTPCIVVSRGLEVPKELIEAAKNYDTPILRSKDSTSNIIAKITMMLNKELAPEISVHGVFIEVYGIGILITGESGIGKSEI
ncbi:HPr kinase/phosphorylase, partial [Streptococcus danieliae]|nr:HPr kinase/phosphorylase [Streptococcus danieliae]